jgi:hypothetical protein
MTVVRPDENSLDTRQLDAATARAPWRKPRFARLPALEAELSPGTSGFDGCFHIS